MDAISQFQLLFIKPGMPRLELVLLGIIERGHSLLIDRVTAHLEFRVNVIEVPFERFAV